MSANRILLIENPASLSIDLGRLRIRRAGCPDSHVLPADIAVLCLHHHTIQVSVHVLRSLAEAGAGVMVTDAAHLPCAWLMPDHGHGTLVTRLRQQIRLDTQALKGVLWQSIVQARLRTQATNLRALNRNGELRLERLAKLVRPGDAGNSEAQGARHYWGFLFDAPFTRHKQGATDAPNARLNYGYAVLRALIARSVVMAGLNPALGLGHCSTANPFNLVDDFIELYRFIVERQVALSKLDEPFDGQARRELLGFVGAEVRLNGAGYRLPAAIQETIASFIRVLDGRRELIACPDDLISKLSTVQSAWA